LLALVAKNRHDEMLALLLRKGLWSPDQEDNRNRTPLLYAAEEGHEAVVKLLLHAGIPQDSVRDGFRTPLSYTAGKGHTVVVALLLGLHANPNLLDGEARTPLSYAAEGGHEAVIKPPVGSRRSSVDQR